MYYKFTKLAKVIIIFNIVLSILLGGMHGYNVRRLQLSNEIVNEYMAEETVSRITAIRYLKKDGVELFLDQEFTTFFGVFMSVLSLIVLLKYAKHNGFMYGFFAALFCVFTSLIGGMLLFALIFSGKSEVKGRAQTKGKHAKSTLNDGWEDYISDKSYDLNEK